MALADTAASATTTGACAAGSTTTSGSTSATGVGAATDTVEGIGLSCAEACITAVCGMLANSDTASRRNILA